MARLIYAVMALALGALVSGFFVSTSNLPLFLSIGFSAAAMLLILFGWSRRIRQGMDLSGEGESAEEMEHLDVVEIEPEGFRPAAQRPAAASKRRRPAAEVAAPTTVIELPPEREPPRAKVPAKAGAKKKPAKKKQAAAKTSSRPSPTRVVVIPGRSRFHRPGCRFAGSDQAREVSEATARRRGYEPCSRCSPSASA